ncbi:MAG: hypothetical protein HQ568_08100, partial [Calditrichaeota bacterium]|nr:hypothetical protein [Calditrichota bacterium]
DEQEITITVSEGESMPVLAAIGDLEIVEFEEFSLQLEANDEDGDELTFEIENLPEGATLENDVFSWTPTGEQSGVYENIIFRVLDETDPPNTDEETITITVINYNAPPILNEIGDQVISYDDYFELWIFASSADNDFVYYYAENLPEGATFGEGGSRFQWTPTEDQQGVYENIIFRAVDNGEPPASDEESITITVTHLNHEPVLTEIGNRDIMLGSDFEFLLEAEDPDGDGMTFEGDNLPEGSSIEGDMFYWTPDNDQVGTHENIVFRVWDDGDPSMFDEETVTFTVVAPTIEASPYELDFSWIWVDDSEERTLTINNIGHGNLTIYEMLIDDDAFIVDFEGEITVEENSSVDFEFTFTPRSEREYEGTLTIVSNDHDNPELSVSLFGIGIEPEGENTRSVVVTEEYVYTADLRNGLCIFSKANPENPELISNYDTDRGAQGVVVAGDYAYVAFGENGLYVIDISNPDNPQERGSVNTPVFARDVALSGNYAYVADDTSGLCIIDISNAANPHEVSSFNTSGTAMSVTVNGSYAYVADMAMGMRIFDISDPHNPSEVGYYDPPGVTMGI